MLKKFFTTLVVLTLVVAFSSTAFAASRNSNYSNWFDLERINAVDVRTNLTREASREEVALLIAYLCDDEGLLPSKGALNFDDENAFEHSSSYRTITRLSATGIVGGYPDGEFKPQNNIKRGETVAIFLRAVDYLNIETESYRRGSSFTDTKGHWAEPYCERAYEMGIVSGRGNGRFYPNANITREELLTMAINLMGESNNPLIRAIDKVYDLEFENSYYEESDRYYDNNDHKNTTSERPERPVVSVNTTTDEEEVATSNGSRPTRPVVDTTSDSSTSSSVERPSVEVEETASGRPTRPTV